MSHESDIELDPAYEGFLCRTQKERVRVFRGGREPLEVDVFRVVNVEDTPELRAPALSGTLHRFDQGGTVDVPFIYHDPAAEQLALVIPDGARGREASERAKLDQRLASVEGTAAPDYIRDFAVVYGCDGLARFISETPEMEVEAEELLPVDASPAIASHFPRLAALVPSAEFWAHTETEMALLLYDDALWIFVQLGEEDHDAFRESSCDLLVQLKMVEQIPVCVLALTDTRVHAVRRAYLNPAPQVDRRVLDLLRRDFQAVVVLMSKRLGRVRSFRIEAPRAANVQRIMDRLELGPRYEPALWNEAAATCRQSPLPTCGIEHPFVIEDAAQTAAEALRRLRRLEEWTSPEKAEEALQILSVPMTVFELAQRRIVADAARFGLAICEPLLGQAVRFGLARRAPELVSELWRRFEQTVGAAFTHGLDQAQIEANREELERLSALHGTSTEPDLSCTIEYSG